MIRKLKLIKNRHFSDIISFLGLFILVIIFFHRIILFGEVMYVGDNLSLILPAKMFIHDALRTGHIPLWNPYVFSGVPFIGEISNGTFYPLNILYFLNHPLIALSYQIIIEIFLAGCFMYIYMRVTKFSYISSFLCAAIYMLSGTLLQITQNTSALDVIIWIPLVLALIEIYVKSKKPSILIFVSIIMSMQIFAGHIQFFYYSLLLYASYIFFKVDASLKNKFFLLGYVCIVSFLLSSIQIIPFLEYTGFSTRPSRDIAFATSGSFHPVSMFHLILPNIFGIQRDGTSWGAQANIYGYIGIIPLILGILSIVRRKGNKHIPFFAGTAIIAFLLSLGKYSPIFYIAFYALPFFSRFRAVSGILLIYTFAMVVLAGYGLEYLHKSKYKVKKPFVILVLISVLLFILKSVGEPHFFSTLSYLNSTDVPFIGRFFSYSHLKQQTIYHLIVENMLMTSVIIFLFALLLHIKFKFRPHYFYIILGPLIIFDLFYFGRNMLITSPNVFVYNASAKQFLKQNTRYERIYSLIDGPQKPLYGYKNYYLDEAYKTYAYFKPNMHAPASLYSIDGYASIVHRDYAAFISPPQKDIPTGIGIPELRGKNPDALSVKYIVTGNKAYVDRLKLRKFTLAYTYIDKNLKRMFYIYENNSALPRTYAINKDNIIGKTTITEYNLNQVNINVSIPKQAQVILSDMYYPGWKAYIDNKETQIRPYKTILRSVEVPKGKHKISYVYEPISLTIGKYLSLAGLMVIVFTVAYEEHTRISQPFHIGKAKIKRNSV